MSVSLIIPGLRDMAARQAWLKDPATGCIEFRLENWRWWRQLWLYNEPDFYSAYIRDGEGFAGEVCWFREGDAFNVGILVAASKRGKGFCIPALRLLAGHAFQRPEIPALQCAFPTANIPARRGFLRAGFHIQRAGGGVTEMLLTREEWERLCAEGQPMP